ncbi:MAG: hypothetical protein JOY82_12820 [Streptosporangiaceae bacterium]|nr:hypothetical protein [Streptosporangiaceae bacterium]
MASPPTGSPAGKLLRPPGVPVVRPPAGTRWALRYRWWALPVAAVLFTCYLRLSWTVPATSDGAAIALQAWDMLHGNVLLHGWTLGDVSFYTTELPEYAGVEAVRGLGPADVHIAAALTYTLLVLLAGLVAKGRATGVNGLVRVLIASGVMLAPQLGHGAFLLLLNPDHVGTGVPLLLTWLVLDRAPRRWYVAVITGLMLAWIQVADRVALVTAVLPLVLVCVFRVCRALARSQAPAGSQVPARRRPPAFELALAAAAILSAAAAWLAGRAITAAGGFTANPLPTVPATLGSVPVHLWLTARGVLALYGAEFPSHGPGLVFAVAHLAGLALAVWAFALAVRRFPREQELIVQVLPVAIVVNLVTYISTNLPGTVVGTGYPTREIAAVLPLGAVLAGRLLAGPLLARHAPADTRPPGRHPLMARWPRLAAPALALCAAGYLAALGYGAAQPAVAAQEQDLAGWLAAHHLTAGLSGPEANVTTLDSGGRVQVMVTSFGGGGGGRVGGVAARAYQSQASWYDPRLHYANFVVTTAPQGPTVDVPYGDAVRTFGPPARVYHFAGYTIVVWDENLLARLGRHTLHPA